MKLFFILTSWFILISLGIPLRSVYVQYRTPVVPSGAVMGIDVTNPSFSWAFSDTSFTQQSFYQIIVNHRLSGEVVWDSSKIQSSQTLHIIYNGKPLMSDSRYGVEVTVWDQAGLEYTGTTQFHSGLLNPADFGGIWIGHERVNMNQLRKEFNVPSAITEATAFICGLGYNELYFNGFNVDPTRKLDPGWTTFQLRALYTTFDVTSLLRVGPNAVGVLLGNGWYSPNENIDNPYHPKYGPPRLLFQLNIKLANGNNMSVVSDTTWMGRQGPILMDSIYMGESIDGRLIDPDWADPGYKADHWWNAVQLPSPGGLVTAQIMEPIRTDTPVKPVSIWGTWPDVYVVDFGQNMAGWVTLKLNGPRGAYVQFRYAELLEQQSSPIYSRSLFVDNLFSAAATDIYIFNGTHTGEIFEPRFTYHGFRYVEIKCPWTNNDVRDILAIPVHSFADTAGNFKSDNKIINRIQSNILWGQKSNLMSVPTDCSQRSERKGWMGDAALTVDEALFNFKLGPFYQNWLQNIQDIQSFEGGLWDTTPYTGGDYPADPAWGTAFPTTLYALYDHYGDLQTANQYYNGIVAWVDFLTKKVNSSGYANMYFSYGDWCTPAPYPVCNQSLVSVASYGIDVLHLSEIANALGKTADYQKYTALYKEIATQFHTAFYQANITGYASDTLTGNVLGLALGAVPVNLKSAVLSRIVTQIQQTGNHSLCGATGTKYLFPLLSDNGYHDLAITLATQITYPSYGWTFNNQYENATTLWERFDAPLTLASRNHIFFGSIGAWFYRYIGGIKPNGLEEIEISPSPVSQDSPVKTATVSYDSLKGMISVHWEKTSSDYRLQITVPSATRARVIIPKHDHPYTLLKLSESMVADFRSEFYYSVHSGIFDFELQMDGSIFLRVEPGSYNFLASTI